MKKLGFVIGLSLLLAFALEAMGAQFEFHGDMNNRFLIYTDRSDWLNSRTNSCLSTSNINRTSCLWKDLSI